MAGRLTGKSVVITGASGGMGREMAVLAAAEGAESLFLLARSQDKLKAVKTEIVALHKTKVTVFTADVSKREDVERVMDKILEATDRRVDVLINNAGFGVFDYFNEAKLDDIEGMFNTNVIGLMACTHRLLPAMLDRGAGHIINVASMAGKISTPKSTVYSASKHAVLGFTNGLRMELEGTGIHVTSVNPGPVRTNFFDIADPDGSYQFNVNKMMVEPVDVARRVIQAIGTSVREINIPKSGSAATKLYQMFPALVEKAAGPMFRKK